MKRLSRCCRVSVLEKQVYDFLKIAVFWASYEQLPEQSGGTQAVGLHLEKNRILEVSCGGVFVGRRLMDVKFRDPVYGITEFLKIQGLFKDPIDSVFKCAKSDNVG
jgi:hypothetical protein